MTVTKSTEELISSLNAGKTITSFATGIKINGLVDDTGKNVYMWSVIPHHIRACVSLDDLTSLLTLNKEWVVL